MPPPPPQPPRQTDSQDRAEQTIKEREPIRWECDTGTVLSNNRRKAGRTKKPNKPAIKVNITSSGGQR